MQFLIALIVGALSAFAFEPVGWWPLMIIAIAILCELIVRAGSLKRVLLVGWGFGLGQFCIGLNWIATAFTFQAAMPAWLGWIAVVLLSLYLAIYPAMAAGLAWRFGEKGKIALVLALAGGWVITEWLRATMFTGFSWNPIGVTLADTPLIGGSRLIGTYGLSALVALIGGSLWLAFRRTWQPLAGVAAASLLLWAVPPPSEVAPTLAPRSIPNSPPAEDKGGTVLMRPIRIVQPNIGQQDKWRPGFEEEAYRRLESLTIKGQPVQRLVFWPEAAVTDPLEDARTGADRYIEEERLRATRTLGSGDILLTGGLSFTSRDGQNVDGATNSVYALEPLGRIVGRYDKAHLVPYGEYLPMRPILSAIGLSRLAPGDLDFTAGPGPRTIQLPGDWGKVGFQLCYEIIFSGQVVDRHNRPDFIFNPSNDAWFGRWGPPQHLAQARLRAAEEGLPVVRSTPTGISALIDPHGAIIQSVPWRTAGMIDAPLPNPLAPTLFAKLGNTIPLSLGFLLLFVAIALDRRARYRTI
ncbi:apolipoprotein N-acyltransferase [Sphingomonas sp. NSE70-1]|uniref:Apolipoprotein N-acyltransferase n=1 Tax=Sphingomonas caseinilyticus TaxID=2908205 RepID=A0ABT0RT80_9SPHN|nr:apolipoprotein N-acyltransferase [Sphingomonas caseinilyticus]MCL6698200.1 apolipoprotein N-acyltransferase [Sphingomonas caseinilyticus]